jgi:hypothetical protein
MQSVSQHTLPTPPCFTHKGAIRCVRLELVGSKQHKPQLYQTGHPASQGFTVSHSFQQ